MPRPHALLVRTWLVAIAVGASACDNACQTLCSHMADYARECGRNISESEVAACETSWAAPTADERAACAEFGDPLVLRRQWTCEDVNLEFDAAAE